MAGIAFGNLTEVGKTDENFPEYMRERHLHSVGATSTLNAGTKERVGRNVQCDDRFPVMLAS
jgi:hypothetical protein